jgi:hypothetical protein
VSVGTDLVQLPIDSHWNWQVIITDPSAPTGEQEVCSWSTPAAPTHNIVIQNYRADFSVVSGVEVHDGEQLRAEVFLLNPTGQVQDESPSWPITWDGSGQLARWILNSQPPAQTGAYTQADRDAAAADAMNNTETNQLALTINAATTAAVNIGTSVLQLPIGQILSSNFSDAFRLEDIGGGVTCDPIRVDISRSALYGVTVRITQYPDTAVFRTPDGAWSFSDLAVLTVTRGGDILARHGIHTTSHTLSPLPETPYPWLTNLGVPIQPSDYHVAVDWAAGVCGELLGLVLP